MKLKNNAQQIIEYLLGFAALVGVLVYFAGPTGPLKDKITELVGDSVEQIYTSHEWKEGEWSECSGACGSYGTQTKEVYCLNASKERVDDSECEDAVEAGIKPFGGPRDCETDPCCITDNKITTPCPCCLNGGEEQIVTQFCYLKDAEGDISETDSCGTCVHEVVSTDVCTGLACLSSCNILTGWDESACNSCRESASDIKYKEPVHKCQETSYSIDDACAASVVSLSDTLCEDYCAGAETAHEVCDTQPPVCWVRECDEASGDCSCDSCWPLPIEPDLKPQKNFKYVCPVEGGCDEENKPEDGSEDCTGEYLACNCAGDVFSDGEGESAVYATTCSPYYRDGLTDNNTPITHVDSVDYCVEEAKCQFYCPEGYVASDDGTICEPNACEYYQGTDCSSCPFGVRTFQFNWYILFGVARYYISFCLPNPEWGNDWSLQFQHYTSFQPPVVGWSPLFSYSEQSQDYYVIGAQCYLGQAFPPGAELSKITDNVNNLPVFFNFLLATNTWALFSPDCTASDALPK